MVPQARRRRYRAHMASATTVNRTGPSVVDRGFQLAYVGAYRIMRLYWALRRPTTNGSLVALYSDGELLLVRNSYLRYYSLPGGYMRRGETARDAAVRELAEEIGVAVDPGMLELVVDETNDWEHKHDHVRIFSLDLAERPEVRVDHREVVQALWCKPESALSLDLFPPVRRAIERRLERRS